MTYTKPYELKCAICGTMVEFKGEWYLESRLKTRSIVRKCPECGYCNTSIEELTSTFDEIFYTEEYKNQLNSKDFPDKANQFLCKSMILQCDGQYEEAAWAAFRASEKCLGKFANQIKKCRDKAIELFLIAIKAFDMYNRKHDNFAVFITDKFRRNEQFELAEQYCKQRLKIEDWGEIIDKLNYQLHLIEEKDSGAFDALKSASFNFWKKLNENKGKNKNPEPLYEEPDYDQLYFDAMTDGQLGDYDDFRNSGGNLDDIDTWSRG